MALSILKACLEKNGISCSLIYPKLDFAARIGFDLYETIAEGIRQELLVGDYVFGEFLNPNDHGATLSACEALSIPEGDFIFSSNTLKLLRHEAKGFLAELSDRILGEGYDLVGMSTTFQISPGLSLARLLKTAARPPMIVLGGSHCDGDLGWALHQCFPWIDFVCRGEGEQLIIDLVQALAGFEGLQPGRREVTRMRVFTGESTVSISADPYGSRLANIGGLVWRDGDGRSVSNGARTAPVAFSDSPIPDFSDYFEGLTRSKLGLDPTNIAVPFESSRGCWFGEKMHCTFCGLNGDTMRFRRKSVDRVLVELAAIAALGAKRADAVDLILDFKAFDSLLPAIEKQNTGLSIFYELKSNLKKEQVRQLKRAGVDVVQPGIESLSTPTLGLMRKGVKALQNIRLLRWLAEEGIASLWNLLYGFPGEDPQDYLTMAKSVPLLVHLQPPIAPLNRVLLNRFSPLFEQREKLGVANVRAVPGYARVFSHWCTDIDSLAYFFDFDHADGRIQFDYVEPLRTAIGEWIEQFGQAALVSVETVHGIRIFDSRPVSACRDIFLEGEECGLYVACESGASFEELRCKTSAGRVSAFLDRGLEEHWLLHIDERYLALPVSISDLVPNDYPESVLESTCIATYLVRARHLKSFAPNHRAPTFGFN